MNKKALTNKKSAILPGELSGGRIFPLPTTEDPYPLIARHVTHLGRQSLTDPTASWLTDSHPEMEVWRALAHRWFSHLSREAEDVTRRTQENPPSKMIRLRASQEISKRVEPLRTLFTQYLQDPRFASRQFTTSPELFLSSESGIIDDFYIRHCEAFAIRYDYRGKPALRNPRGASYVNAVCGFLEWCVSYLSATSTTTELVLRCPFRRRSETGTLLEKRLPKTQDLTLGWVQDECPQMEQWRVLAELWIKEQTTNVPGRLKIMCTFIGRYLTNTSLVPAAISADPSIFLRKGSGADNNFRSTLQHLREPAREHNPAVDFLDWVLLRDFSEVDDYGHPVLSPAFRNPLIRMDTKAPVKPLESVRTPLPYAYIDELRRMLASGPSFKDWTWAQGSLAGNAGWFPVPEALIDVDDPDCVFRRRPVTHQGATSDILEMWSPVRWVALLTKLILPLRTFQVRVLDSGEADTWYYDGAQSQSGKPSWAKNVLNRELRDIASLDQLAHGTAKRSRTKRHAPDRAQGVFRREVELEHSKSGVASHEQVLLYINTNKTADRGKEGTAKGYTMPWPVLPWPRQDGTLSYSESGDLAQNIHYWLQKLRDWQTKYNPATSPTAWRELIKGGVIAPKNQNQLAAYDDSVFLFRDPSFWGVRETRSHEIGQRSRLPITDAVIRWAWCALLMEYERRLAQRGETAPDGTPVRLVAFPDDPSSSTTFFPLHSLRVSLVTALALEGGMSLTLLQKIVGHSRLIMTLYYTKPGSARMQDEIKAALGRLDETKEQSVLQFIRASTTDELRNKAAVNDFTSVISALGEAPTNRNPVGWLPMFHGMCTVGGNTDLVDSNTALNGCHNGGSLVIGSEYYGPVQGGARNCVRCRWFLTEPRYLENLVAHFNNVSYHFHEAQLKVSRCNEELNGLKNERFDAEQSGERFQNFKLLADSERRFEKAAKDLEQVGQTLVACHRLIQRCWAILEERGQNGGDQVAGTPLVAVGMEPEVDLIVESVDSELLQLTGVLEDAELYPDLDPGKAVLRRSQILDQALAKDNIRPFFLTLSEEQQHSLGNEFMRRLAAECGNGLDTANRRRVVVQMLDGTHGRLLSEMLGISPLELASMLPTTAEPKRFSETSRVARALTL